MPPKKQKVTMYAQSDMLEAPTQVGDGDALPSPPPVKEKKPRTPAQLAATEKLLALNKEKKRLRDEEKAKAIPPTASVTKEVGTGAEHANQSTSAPATTGTDQPKRKRKPKKDVPSETPVAEKVDGAGATTATEEMEPIPATVNPSDGEPKPKKQRVKRPPKVKGATPEGGIAKLPPKPRVESEMPHYAKVLLQRMDDEKAEKEKRRAEKELRKAAEIEQVGKLKYAGQGEPWQERNAAHLKIAQESINNLTSSIFG